LASSAWQAPRARWRRGRVSFCLDEPAAGLSHGELDVLCAAILGVRSAQTFVLIVEHNVEFVLSFCDRVVVMNFGRKIAEGRPDEIRHNETVIEAYLGRKH